MSLLQAAGLGGLQGFIFGFSSEKSGVANPAVLRGSVTRKNTKVLQYWLGSIATSSATFALLNGAGLAPLDIKHLHFSPQLIGGLLMGSGMYITGAAPETALVQIGSGRHEGCWTLLGSLAGVTAYAFAAPRLLSWMDKNLYFLNKSSLPLSVNLGVPFWALAIPVSLGAAAGAYYLHKEEQNEGRVLSDRDDALPPHVRTRWPAAIAGAIVGELQAPSLLHLGVGLGVTSAFVTATGLIFRSVGWKNMPAYFAGYLGTRKAYWQLALDGAIIGGAFLSAYLSGTFDSNVKVAYKKLDGPVSTQRGATRRLWYVAGGFLLVFGARLADGCTTGHLITGVAQLVPSSLVTLAGLGAGALITSELLRGNDVVEDA